jgi:hypothetical protein
MKIITFLMMMAAATSSVSGQEIGRPFVGLVAGGHYEDADRVNGLSPAVGITAGIRLSPRFGVELDLARPSAEVVREYTGPSVSFAGPSASYEEFARKAVITRYVNGRQILLSVSGGLSYYLRPRGRWMPRLYFGLSNHRALERADQIHLSIPAGIDPERVRRTMPPQAPYIRNLGALTAGVSVAFAVTRHLSIAPDLRYDYGSIGDEINNFIRPSVRVLWRF